MTPEEFRTMPEDEIRAKAAAFLEVEWSRAFDVKVDSAKLDSEGHINCWTRWHTTFEDHSELFEANIRFRLTEDGEWAIL